MHTCIPSRTSWLVMDAHSCTQQHICTYTDPSKFNRNLGEQAPGWWWPSGREAPSRPPLLQQLAAGRAAAAACAAHAGGWQRSCDAEGGRAVERGARRQRWRQRLRAPSRRRRSPGGLQRPAAAAPAHNGRIQWVRMIRAARMVSSAHSQAPTQHPQSSTRVEAHLKQVGVDEGRTAAEPRVLKFREQVPVQGDGKGGVGQRTSHQKFGQARHAIALVSQRLRACKVCTHVHTACVHSNRRVVCGCIGNAARACVWGVYKCACCVRALRQAWSVLLCS